MFTPSFQCLFVWVWSLYRTDGWIYTMFVKNIVNIIDCHLKKGYPIIIIFSTNISSTAGHQTSVQFSTSHNVCFCASWRKQNQRNMSEMNRNTSKSIPNIIDCDLKQNWQIFIIFGANIFDTIFHQMTILVPTSQNVCFCTTWENPNRWNWIKMQYFVGFVSPGSAEADSGCGAKLDSHLIAGYVRNTGVKNY